MVSAFKRRGADPAPANTVEIEKLHSKIGQLVVERNFWSRLMHASMHCRAMDASVQLLGTRGKKW